MLSGDRIHRAVRTKKRNKLPFLQKPPFFISPNVVGTGISLNYPLTLSMSRFVPVNLVSQFLIESLVLKSHREDTSTKIASRIKSHRDKNKSGEYRGEPASLLIASGAIASLLLVALVT